MISAVKGCVRCGLDHDVEFKEFTESPVIVAGTTFTHWGVCSNKNEPILMYIVEKETTEWEMPILKNIEESLVLYIETIKEKE